MWPPLCLFAKSHPFFLAYKSCRSLIITFIFVDFIISKTQLHYGSTSSRACSFNAWTLMRNYSYRLGSYDWEWFCVYGMKQWVPQLCKSSLQIMKFHPIPFGLRIQMHTNVNGPNLTLNMFPVTNSLLCLLFHPKKLIQSNWKWTFHLEMLISKQWILNAIQTK